MMGKSRNKYSYKLDIIVDGYFTSDSTMIDFQLKYCTTDFFGYGYIASNHIHSHKIKGDLEPMVVEKVLQNFQVRYKYFAVTR